jgi:hypothetical protein
MADTLMVDTQEDSRMDLPKQSTGGQATIRGCDCRLLIFPPGVGARTGLARTGGLLALRVVTKADGRRVTEVAPGGEGVCGRRHSFN